MRDSGNEEVTTMTSYCALFQRGNLTYLLCGDGGLCQALEQVNF